METFLGIFKHYDTRTCAVASNVTTLPTLVRHHVRLESLVSSLKGLYKGGFLRRNIPPWIIKNMFFLQGHSC